MPAEQFTRSAINLRPYGLLMKQFSYLATAFQYIRSIHQLLGGHLFGEIFPGAATGFDQGFKPVLTSAQPPHSVWLAPNRSVEYPSLWFLRYSQTAATKVNCEKVKLALFMFLV